MIRIQVSFIDSPEITTQQPYNPYSTSL